MSTAYKALSTWWWLVSLCGLLVVCTSSVFLVPTASVHSQPNDTCPTPSSSPQSCRVQILNNTNMTLFIAVNYRSLQDEPAEVFVFTVRPGDRLALSAFGEVTIEVAQAVFQGSGFIPLRDGARTVRFTPSSDTLITISINEESGEFEFRSSPLS